MVNRPDSVGLTIGNVGQHSALAVVSTEQEAIGKDPGTWAVQWQIRSTLIRLVEFGPNAPIAQLAGAIKTLHEKYLPSDPKRFGKVLIDVDHDSDVAREFWRLLEPSKIGVLASPVVEEAIDKGVRREDLIHRWQIAIQRKEFFVAEGVNPQWRDHATALDAGLRWRQTDRDYLASAICLAIWPARTPIRGERREWIA